MNQLRSSVAIAALILLSCTSPEGSQPLGEEPGWAEHAVHRLPALELCSLPNLDELLLCGSLGVPEDRNAPEDRTVQLKIVVVPAQSEEPPNDAVFVFEGGPGGAVTARAVGSAFSGRVRDRDIVLVDQRGTGGSGLLDCDLSSSSSAESEPGRLREMFPLEGVRACAQELSQTADLARYGSIDHADDVEAVRQHLGYDQLNLRGGSYGTRAMMVYAQRYPDRVRSMFGIGVDSPLRSNLAERATSAVEALAGLSELCARDAGCAALLPNMAEAAHALLERVQNEPVDVRMASTDSADSSTSESSDETVVHLTHGWLAEQLRLLLYFDFTTNPLAWALHRAHIADDWLPLTRLAIAVENMFNSSLATGVVLTVQCGENLQFDHDAALHRERATVFGAYRLEQQLQGCSVWPHQQQPPLGSETPAVLDIPAFFLSGAFDPVTPPRYVDDAQELFPNSIHLVLPEGQHGPFTLQNSWECVHNMWADLLDSASTENIDTSCSANIRRGPFITNAADFEQHFDEVLGPQTG